MPRITLRTPSGVRRGALRGLLTLVLAGPLAGGDPARASTAAPGDGGALSTPLRRALESAGTELADAGRADEARRVLSVLAGLGLEERRRDRLERRWERRLEEAPPARPAAGRPALDDVLVPLERAAEELEKLLVDAPPPERAELARSLLAIDDQNPAANRALGNSLHEGLYVSPERARQGRERARIGELERWAGTLELPLERGPSELAARAGLGDLGVRRVSAEGLAVHGTLPPERLGRALVQTLRAAAFSYATVTGERRLPRVGVTDFLVLRGSEYALALERAAAAGGVRPEDMEALRRQSSFLDSRGWRTCLFRNEADLEAMLLYDLASTWLGWTSQPVLVAGHVNWVCLRRFGTLLPYLSWRDERERAGELSRSTRVEVADALLWRAASRGLYGTRLYVRRLVERDADPPFARCVADEVGKIQGMELAKATLVVEFLHESGEFAQVLDASRGTRGLRPLEEALGRPLTTLEHEWRAWLLGPEPGLVQALSGSRRRPDPVVLGLLDDLRRVRTLAFRAALLPASEVWLDPQLSDGAALHAAYLERHPEQQSLWPGAHEEYPDRAGFSSAGAWAADRSVIHIGEPSGAVDAWLRTFYHRLPLLDPGLVGCGLGHGEEVVVADVLSLVAPVTSDAWVVWPPDGAEDVPLDFHPELPPPVPGRETSELGMPVTLQAFGALADDARIELELHLRGPDGPPVAGTLSTPDAPSNPALAPRGAFAFLPDEHLLPETRYVAVARRQGSSPRTLVWTFTTGEER